MTDFEVLLRQHYGPLERFVKFRMEGTGEAEDILQEVSLTAFQKFHQLSDKEKFKPWLLQIARNKCRDYYRKQQSAAVPLEDVAPWLTAETGRGAGELLDGLPPEQRQLLLMYYGEDLSQKEIAEKLDIPVGTVKSRLYAARQALRAAAPRYRKGETTMKQLPEKMPAYTITPSTEGPFPVKWEEVMGWFIVPRQGEKLTWAMYDFPEKTRGMWLSLEVTDQVRIHGVEGVEIAVLEHDPKPSEQLNAQNPVERYLVAQLTDTHCRLLAESHTKNGVRECYTFLDGDDFLGNWGFGPENCGNAVDLAPKGLITRQGDQITVADTPWPLDVVGRYTVESAGKAYDTVCVVDVGCYDEGVCGLQYLDKNGRTVLWRKFHRDDWAFHHFKELWTEKLPNNQRLTIDGETYVHACDIITNYVL